MKMCSSIGFNVAFVLTVTVGILLNSITPLSATQRDLEISLTADLSQDQKLSPFELAMVSDLLIQITLHKCPMVSRPGVRSMKQYIFTTLAKAPESGVAHPQFYSNYRNLVQCLSYLDDHFPKKSLSRIYESVSDTGKGRRKRETIESVEEVNDLIPQQKDSLSDSLQPTEGSKLQPFELLFLGFQQLVESSCPRGIGPQSHFIARSVKEIVGWVHNHKLVMKAAQKYFDKMGILNQFQNCFRTTQKSLSS